VILGMDGTGNWYVSVSVLRVVCTTQMVYASVAKIGAKSPKGGTPRVNCRWCIGAYSLTLKTCSCRLTISWARAIRVASPLHDTRIILYPLHAPICRSTLWQFRRVPKTHALYLHIGSDSYMDSQMSTPIIYSLKYKNELYMLVPCYHVE
jgi:hypothetical protein